jgi:hypothetical protein
MLISVEFQDVKFNSQPYAPLGNFALAVTCFPAGVGQVTA